MTGRSGHRGRSRVRGSRTPRRPRTWACLAIASSPGPFQRAAERAARPGDQRIRRHGRARRGRPSRREPSPEARAGASRISSGRRRRLRRGIDLCHGRNDGPRHEGDPQVVDVDPRYGDRPPWHDVQLRLEGPAVGAGGDRVGVCDLESVHGTPIYVHAKVCVIDDVWLEVGSGNICRRSWTHDSELSCSVLDATLDDREPIDPGGRGDRARVLPRDTRLRLWREHLGRATTATTPTSSTRCRGSRRGARRRRDSTIGTTAVRVLARLGMYAGTRSIRCPSGNDGGGASSIEPSSIPAAGRDTCGAQVICDSRRRCFHGESRRRRGMLEHHGDVAQLARAPALQAGGRGFESHRLHCETAGQRRCATFPAPSVELPGRERAARRSS
jgi:hypothetical protein